MQSLADQIRELKALARREGLSVTSVFEEAKSAKAPYSRPEFQKLVEAIDAGKVTGVLTWSISRLSRNPVDGGVIAYLLQTGKLDFIRTAERTYRPEDNAILMSIENGMATAYIQDLKRNVLRGMAGKIQRGWHTAKAPVGYKNDRESREIVPDPERWSTVRRGWDLMLAGRSNAEVYRYFIEHGLTVSTRRRTPRLISRTRAWSLFTDRFYLGEIKFQGETFQGKHKPMVSLSEFLSVQQHLARGKSNKTPNRLTFAFAGSLRCANCGCAVVAEKRVKVAKVSGNKATYIYYHCSGYKGCPKIAIREEELAVQAKARIEISKLVPSFRDWLEGALEERVEEEVFGTSADLSALKSNSARCEERLRRLTDMRLDGEISASEYAQRKQVLEGEINLLREAARDAKDAGVKLLTFLSEKLAAAVAANDLPKDKKEAYALGHIMRIGAPHYLNLKNLELRTNPVLEKIAAFEPPGDGSWSPKVGDVVPRDSKWWALVNDLLTVASDQIDKEYCTHAQRRVKKRYADLLGERWLHGRQIFGETEIEEETLAA